ncbi:MAG: hypothetical protein ACK41D_04005 [Rubricoccaceae bacterium]
MSALAGTLPLAGCDASAPTVEALAPVADRGPALSAFPAYALVRAGDVARRFPGRAGTALSVTGGFDESVVLVPLVFDPSGHLHSPASFRAHVDSTMDARRRGGPEREAGEVWFTDLATFRRVVEGSVSASAQGGRASATEAGPLGLYGGGRRLVLPLHVADPSSSAVDGESTYVDVYDPYVMPVEDCGPESRTCGDGTGGGGGSGSSTGRPSSNVSAQFAAGPTWPQMWVGDVVSGERASGSSSGPSNLGHTLIITRLSSGQRTGGDFDAFTTRSMEATGYQPNRADEVVERTARTWFGVPDLNYVKVRYHRRATWSERKAAIAIARAQDPDPYSVWTSKTNSDYWYCSKLVWYAYRYSTGDSLDSDWGFWVFPNDIENSGHLVTVYYFVRQA